MKCKSTGTSLIVLIPNDIQETALDNHVKAIEIVLQKLVVFQIVLFFSFRGV